MLASCSIERYLSADKPLYSSSEIEIINPEQVPNPKALTTTLAGYYQQEPASNLGMWWWFKLESEKEKGLKPWLRRTLGAEPVYYDEALTERTMLLMRDYLKDHGYFGSELDHDTIRTDSFYINVQYELKSRGRARFDTVVWPKDSSSLGQFLRDQKPATFAKQGTYYSVAALDAERARLDQLSSRAGYYSFAKSNIYYIVDSIAGDNQTRVYMNLDKGSDSLAFKQYRIGKTYVFPNYSLGRDSASAKRDTSLFEDDIYVIRDANERLHASVLARRIGLRRNDVYNESIYRNTLNQLLDLGVFKYVNYSFERRLTDSTPVLDQYIYLTQGQSQSVGVDLETTTRAGSSVPGLNATIRHTNNNLFNGAEDLRVSASYGVGVQTDITDFEETVTATDIAASAEIALPRFIGPFAKEIERTAYYIPRTVASVRVQQTIRPEFSLSNITARLGYRYRANQFVTHELYPINLSYTSITDPSDTFLLIIGRDRRLAQAFEDLAIAGLEYIYRYNDQAIASTSTFWNIEGGIKTSGNISGLLATTPDDGGPDEVAGVRLSQYFRTYIDGRRTTRLSSKNSLAMRAYIGFGLPYGNSEVIPYVDQFFAGGPNSIRAFRLRGVGPGRTDPPSRDNATATSLNQSGDIRLELNAEYRFDVVPFVEGAVFTDVGNVWLARDIGDINTEGLFEFGDFYEELAVGVGAGIRLDFDIILIRFDYAAPIRLPWRQGADAWVFDRFNIFDSEVRSMAAAPRFHIAIGYPF